MRLLLLLVMLLLQVIAVARLLRCRFELALPIVGFGLVLILYLLGLFGVLGWGVGVFWVLGAAALAVCAVSIKDRGFWLREILTPGFVVFCLFVVVVILWGQAGRRLWGMDEFSHWGTIVKNMFYNNNFGNVPPTTAHFLGYPPGTSLFHYLWQKFCGTFSEANLYRSMCFLQISLWLPGLASSSWKERWALLPKALVLMLLPLGFYPDFYASIYVDAYLGMLFGYIMATYFIWGREPHKQRFAFPGVVLALFMLSITKASGLGLALIAVTVMLWDIAKTWLKNRKLNSAAKPPLSGILLLAAPLAGYSSWGLYRVLNGVREAWNTSGITSRNLVELFTLRAPDYRYEVLTNYTEAFFGGSFASNLLRMSPFLWAILLGVAAWLLIRRTAGDEKPHLKRMMTGLLVGGVVYIGSLLLLYLFSYSQYEATSLASMDRYLGTYYLGVLFLLVSLGMHRARAMEQKEGWGRRCAAALLVLVLFINPQPILNVTLMAPVSARGTRAARAGRDAITRILPLLDTRQDRVYYIFQNTDGYAYNVCRFSLTPARLDIDPARWSLGEPYHEGDLWSVNLTAAEWKDLLLEEGYTYVYLDHVDDVFVARYGELFENNEDIGDGRLFRVQREGAALLAYVDI